MALFDLYAEYINTKKNEPQDPYEILKLERASETLVKKDTSHPARDEAFEEVFCVEDAEQETYLASPALVIHETTSKLWALKGERTAPLPRQLFRTSMLETIGGITNCRLVIEAETGVVTVKGDNDHSVNKTIEELEKIATAFSILNKSAQVFNFLIPEAEIDFSLLIRSLDEASDQKSTTSIRSNLLRPSEPLHVGIILMVKMGKGVITQSKTRATKGLSAPSDLDFWRSRPILPYGNQSIDVPTLESRMSCTPSLAESLRPAVPLRNNTLSNSLLNTGFASNFVEEWVEQTSHAKNNPFEPVKDSPSDVQATVSDIIEANQSSKLEALPVKRRHIRTRKAPGGHNIENVERDDGVGFRDRQVTLSNRALVSVPAPQLEACSHNLIDISIDEDPANTQPEKYKSLSAAITTAPFPVTAWSSSGTRSYRGSQKSTPQELRSATPSTHVSAAPQDLLTGGQPIVYPAVDHAPAINAPFMPPLSSQASIASDFHASSETPTWLKQNPTAKASSETKKGSFLIADAEDEPSITQPESYLAAAKRGAIRSRGPQRGRATTRGRVYKGLAPSYGERVQSSPEVQSRQVYRTMNQKMAKPSLSPASLLKGMESAAVQLLQSTRVFRGIVNLEVEIGRILIKGENNALGRTFSSSEWSSVFASQAGNKIETIFSDLLPISDTDIRFVANLKQSNGRRIFAENAHDSTLKYQFLCETTSGNEEYTLLIPSCMLEDPANVCVRVILEVDDSGHVQVLGTQHLVGAVNWHFPKRQWDARLAVKATEQIEDFQISAEAIAKTLSIIPSADQRTARLFAELGNSDLIFKSASIVREVKFRCLIHPNIVMSFAEVQYLGLAKERHRYYNPHREAGAAKKNGDLWWEIKLRSTDVENHLQQNQNLVFGDQVDWKAEDITRGGVVKQLYSLASEIVTQIDGIGAAINKSAETASMAKHSEAKKEPATQASSFW
ncbi:MAG: hypothetical protein Q9225_002511 [Loekoesia sp. 1 TL-2023]